MYADDLDMLEAVDIEPLDVPAQEAIWEHVSPRALHLERDARTQSVYLTLACECAWEAEHGLQLVYRRGERLTCVSEGGGYLTGPSRYSLPDEEDMLPS